jgi:membrane-associated protease RseP (regulator of RpoE activity)
MHASPSHPITRKAILVAGLLVVAVAAAGSGLAAQEPQEPRERPRAPRMFTFESQGTQIGVTVRDLEAAELAGPVTGGVRIDAVQPDSAAARAGLQPGDIVTAFDAERVRSTRQFSRLVQETPDGRTVEIRIVRAGQQQTLEVTPERRARRFDTGAFRDLEPRLRQLEPRLREELQSLGPRLRDLESRLRESEPEIRERLSEIERLLRQLLEKNQG